MTKIIIDATNSTVGRIASYTAKQALLGNDIIIINSEKAIISGNKKTIIEKFKRLRSMGGSAIKGPFVSRKPQNILKRSIRNMLPDYRKGRGREAWKKIKCFEGIPSEYKDEKAKKLTKNIPIKHISLKELEKKA